MFLNIPQFIFTNRYIYKFLLIDYGVNKKRYSSLIPSVRKW